MLQPTSRIDAIAQRFVDVPGGLLPALHALQHEFGYVDPAAVPVLAGVFNLSTAEVHGVLTFYADFRTTRPKGPVVQICRAEACQARGADAVVARAHQVVEAGAAIELAEVFCLGNCALGPSASTPGQVHGRLDPDAVEVLISEVLINGLSRANAPASMQSAAVAVDVDLVTVYVPIDAAARSAGADATAAALAARPDVRVVRNGSRGMLWLEPMIEVATADGRVAYGPVAADDVDGAARGRRADGRRASAAARPGRRTAVAPPTEPSDVPSRGRHRPASRQSSTGPHGGLAGLRRALSMTPAEVVTEVTESGLRGRGGAAFPTGIKWATVAGAAGDTKYIVCNADEGDSGTFADRMLIEGDPLH